MTDERAYRGNNHPPTCICVDCEMGRVSKNFTKRIAKWRTLIFLIGGILIIGIVAILLGILL